jgi:F0F1-type ATP synthase epsilon subunit
VPEQTLRLELRTPQALVATLEVASLRVPTDSGQVGLRPRAEPAVLAVEPGLAVAHTAAGLRLLATAGGLLRLERDHALLLTPLAVVGESEQDVRARLEEAMAEPTADAELRRAIERLEHGILQELRRGLGARPTAPAERSR